jgi:hypothetical protein
MKPHSLIHAVFGHFQNLNLIFLLDDLRIGRTAKGAWTSGKLLCPVAHGLRAGQLVDELHGLSQSADLGRACDYAARHLGADPARVYQFVELWDTHQFSSDWLVRQLEDLWEERLADAEAVQELLTGQAAVSDQSTASEMVLDFDGGLRWPC